MTARMPGRDPLVGRLVRLDALATGNPFETAHTDPAQTCAFGAAHPGWTFYGRKFWGTRVSAGSGFRRISATSATVRRSRGSGCVSKGWPHATLEERVRAVTG
ncbi:hypothetical protein [Dietzia sp. B32]|uniref:hypothetical protein n=1 Tax=Dietzia sp. B32 TaxID=2915130 RepID=UPI0021AD9AA5|nr:hypothetical protein [Dietzia sp. B32]UVE96099.1 hypothetical protein L8M95_04775 [Dietzia sp. B32]